MSGHRRLFTRRPRPPRWTLIRVAVVLAIAGCTSGAPRSPESAPGPELSGSAAEPGSSGNAASDRLHQEAQAGLARWADAVADAKKRGPVFVGELTGQTGAWEEPVGSNNKSALMSGKVRPIASLSVELPPPGEVRWSDGTSTTVGLLSADQALDEIMRSAGMTCPDCRPLEITAARLSSGSVQTSRGPAIAPIWEFSVLGTSVKVTRVAVAHRVSVAPPPWDPNNAPEGISIDSARGTADARQLTVSFVGAPGGADQPCGADYSAEAVESQLAAVVIVVEHRNPTAAICAAVGAQRTAVVGLASPLGDRAVLEVQQGLPVPVLAP